MSAFDITVKITLVFMHETVVAIGTQELFSSSTQGKDCTGRGKMGVILQVHENNN